jgi:hypothetical protein
MKIYVGHSSGYDYQNELYKPIRASQLNNEYTFLLPHEKSTELFPSLEFFRTKQIDLFIAEVSYPSTGLGIELGQASLYAIPIVCIFKNGLKYSSSIAAVTNDVREYTEVNLIEVLENIVKNK